MAINILEIPEAVPFRFVTYDVEMPAMYHLPTFGNGMHIDRLREWDHKIDYAQKWQTSDNWQFQCAAYDAVTTNPGAPKLYLVDAGGREWHSWEYTFMETVPGDVATIDGTDYALDRFHFFGSFSDVSSLPEGRYWLMLITDFVTSERITKISEPLDIAADHPNTVLLEYYNTRNEHHTIFRYGDINARFTLRVHGHLYGLTPESEDTAYEDQQFNPQLLKSYPYRSWKFGMGYQPGVAEWMMDKVNRVFACNRVKIEGVSYMKAPGAKWEVKRLRGGSYPLVYPEITVRETDNVASSLTIQIGSIPLWQRPGAYPYAIHSLELGSLTIEDAIVFDNSGEETAFLALLNGYLSNVNALTGTFAVSGGGAYTYTNGVGETYATGGAVVLPTFFSMSRPTTALSATTTFTNSGTVTVIDWGEGSDVRVGDPLGTSNTPSKTYTVGLPSTKTIRIFHDDNLSVFDYPLSRISAHSGTFPDTLETLALTDGTLATFTATTLNPALLESLDVSGQTSLASVVGFAKNWVVLTEVDFSGGVLDSTDVDALFNDFVNTTPVLPINGTFDTSGQTPAAPPTAASLTSRNALTAAGWTVTTD